MLTTSKILVVIFSLLIINPSFAQQIQGVFDNTHHNTVIAKSGLNLRTMPQETGEVLQLIPFGAQVEILGEAHYGYEPAIASHTYFYLDRNAKTGELEKLYYDVPLDGFWLKVRYEGQEGYAFSAYLHESMKDEPEDGVSLLFEGANINFYYNPEWYWYALYADGKKQLLKEVKLDFFSLISDATGDAELHVKTNVIDKKAIMIVGSNTPMPYEEINGMVLSGTKNIYNYMEQTIDRSILQQANLKLNANMNEDGEHIFNALSVKGGAGAQQIVSTFDTCNFCAPLLIWYGDIDGDGKTDYLISEVTHYGGPIKLYLSSLADKNKLLKEVATWFPPACC